MSVVIAPTIPRTNGRLHLCFRQELSASTKLHVREQTPPLRVVRSFTNGQSALVHLHNLSGGVLGGDRYEVRAHVEESAQAQLTTTGATRVYRHREGLPDATQINHFHVAQGGVLEYLPDPLIPYAKSRYQQKTTIDLDVGAGLFYWEVVTPGREASDELFVYDLLQMQLQIRGAGLPIVTENLSLQPIQQPLDSNARLGPYRYFGSFYICKVGLPAQSWLELEAELDTLCRQMSDVDKALWGVSTMPAHGLTVRVLSHSGRPIAHGLQQFWQKAKMTLYDQEALAPRKVY